MHNKDHEDLHYLDGEYPTTCESKAAEQTKLISNQQVNHGHVRSPSTVSKMLHYQDEINASRRNWSCAIIIIICILIIVLVLACAYGIFALETITLKIHCDSEGKVALSNTSVCGRYKQCRCEHGVGANSTDCPKDGVAKCAVCNKDHWLNTDSYDCRKLSDCDAQGKRTVTIGTRTTDNKCGDVKICKCPNGVPEIGVKCPQHDKIKCNECNQGFYNDFHVCKPHTDCNSQGLIQQLLGTKTTDTQCGRPKICHCPLGVGAIGKACPRHGMDYCISCQSQQYSPQRGNCIPVTSTVMVTDLWGQNQDQDQDDNYYSGGISFMTTIAVACCLLFVCLSFCCARGKN